MSTKTKDVVKPLPLAKVLQDLAVLRASGIEIPPVLTSHEGSKPPALELVASSVLTSYEFVRYSRGAIKLHHSGKVEVEGQRIEEIRAKYKAIHNALQARSPPQE